MQAFAKLLGQSSGNVVNKDAAAPAATSSASNASAIPLPAQSAKFSPAAMPSVANPQPKVETIAHLPVSEMESQHKQICVFASCVLCCITSRNHRRSMFDDEKSSVYQ